MITFPNAKINLGLYITERRPDGYHNLETLFLPVGLKDALEITLSDDFGFRTSGLELEGDAETNLVVRAFRLLQRDFSLQEVKIHLHKVIPPGAGLGGGSSDAAFTLKMINSLFGLKLSIWKLEEYASELGADCPFFIRNTPALAKGKGDMLTPFPMDLTGYRTVIVKPPVMVNTARAYKSVSPRKPEIPLQEIVSRSPELWQKLLENDFERSVFPSFPQIEGIKSILTGNGAVYASMSGSGSAVFGLFREVPGNLKSLFPGDYFFFEES